MKKTAYYLIIFILFFSLQNCKSSYDKNKLRVIRTELDLTRKEYKSIKTNDSILKNLHNSISNSVNTKLINRRLDSFFEKVYNEKDLIDMLKVDLFFKDDPSFEVERLFDKNIKNTLKVDSIQQVRDYYKNFEDSFKNNSKQKDSLN